MLPDETHQSGHVSDEETKSTSSEFENLSMDAVQWNLLVKQLEDVALLEKVLKQKLKVESPSIYILPYERPSVSLAHILEKGKGKPLSRQYGFIF